jgi:hypothetical protein
MFVYTYTGHQHTMRRSDSIRIRTRTRNCNRNRNRNRNPSHTRTRKPFAADKQRRRVGIVFASHIPLHKNSPHRKQPERVYQYANLKRLAEPPHTNTTTNHNHSHDPYPQLGESAEIRIPSDAVFRLFYFVHVPKTGGVALKKSLHDHHSVQNLSTQTPQNMLIAGRPIRTTTTTTTQTTKTCGCYSRVLSRGHLSASDIDPRVATFCMLREPCSRVRSAFRFLSEGGKHGEVWDYPERAMMNLFQKHRIRTISDIFELKDPTLKKRILAHPHMRPQHEFVCAPKSDEVIVDDVFVLEQFDANRFATLLRLKDFALDVRNKSQIPYTLSATDEQHIRQYYARDFELYARFAHGKSHPPTRCVKKNP